MGDDSACVVIYFMVLYCSCGYSSARLTNMFPLGLAGLLFYRYSFFQSHLCYWMRSDVSSGTHFGALPAVLARGTSGLRWRETLSRYARWFMVLWHPPWGTHLQCWPGAKVGLKSPEVA